MTAAAGYIRESTIAQGDRYGPDAQRAAIATPVCKVDPAGVRSGLHTVRVDELTAAEHARWLEAIA
jgi:hypothetical protein